jgi:pimeloyl-ACP methyl ester carboxylesterase
MEVVTIEDAGHWVHAEKPKEFLEAVLAFIKG